MCVLQFAIVFIGNVSQFHTNIYFVLLVCLEYIIFHHIDIDFVLYLSHDYAFLYALLLAISPYPYGPAVTLLIVN